MKNEPNDDSRMLFLGIGNYLMGDEGVGVHVANRLAATSLPEGVDVLDGGTGGFHLMGIMEQYPVIVMVDATLDGRPAGTIRLLEPRFANDFPRAMSTHDIGLRDVMEGMAILGKMPKIYLFVVSVETLQPMEIELSPAVDRAANEVVEQVRSLIWRLRSGAAVEYVEELSLLRS